MYTNRSNGGRSSPMEYSQKVLSVLHGTGAEAAGAARRNCNGNGARGMRQRGNVYDRSATIDQWHMGRGTGALGQEQKEARGMGQRQ
jgi:hypothetical protein